MLTGMHGQGIVGILDIIVEPLNVCVISVKGEYMAHPNGGHGQHHGMRHSFNAAVAHIRGQALTQFHTEAGALITATTRINRNGIVLIEFKHNYPYTVCSKCWEYPRNCEGKDGVRIGHYTVPFDASWL